MDFLTSGVPLKYRRKDIVVYPNNTVLYQGRDIGDPGLDWFSRHHIERERKCDSHHTIDGLHCIVFATSGNNWSDERKELSRVRRLQGKI